MRDYTLLCSVVLSLLWVSVANGQQNTNLKGPFYKNAKPWKSNNFSKQKSALVLNNKILLTGPQAKNSNQHDFYNSSVGIQLSSVKTNSFLSKNPIAVRRMREKVRKMERLKFPRQSVVRSEFE